MRRHLVLVAVVLLAFAGLTSAGDSKKDLALLQGNWTVESIKESDGKGPPDDVVKTFLVVIKDDIFTLTDKSGTLAALKMKLDPTKKPKTIDLTHQEGPDKGKTEPGIYKIEGDTLTFAVNDPGMERPTAFETKAKTKISVLVMKKAKK
jgi:uncharacterized protein (TIGR03067 family)